MMYQIKRNNKSSFGSNKFRLPRMFLIIVILIFIFVVVSFRSVIGSAFSPFFKFGDSFYNSLDWLPNFFTDKVALIEQNEKLLEKINDYEIQAINYESAKSENQKLREDLKMKPKEDFKTAGILARSPQIPKDSLLLDKGSNDGIKNGEQVLAGDRVLIGKIVEVSKSKSTVALSSAVDRVSYGFIARTNEAIEIIGEGGGLIEAKVPIDFNIEVGDKIMIGGSFNYLAAIVSAIEEDRSSGFKNAMMSLPVDISKIDIVFTPASVNE
jgi:rod shape-determining protein MreC